MNQLKVASIVIELMSIGVTKYESAEGSKYSYRVDVYCGDQV